MFHEVTASKCDSRCKVSPEVLDELAPVVLSKGRFNSLHKIEGQGNLVRVNGHVDGVDSALGIGLA